ncbi:hypothetical protein BDP67DRAFT_563164 [Colletotrichum lupini]|nr:hypothetical protein BDP67DRAFT_563164 [Colletotrichum lupini]
MFASYAAVLAVLATTVVARTCPAGLMKCTYVGPEAQCYVECTLLIGECKCPANRYFEHNGASSTLPNTGSGCSTKPAIAGLPKC